MATLEQLSAALVKADAAGNTADAKAFADAIRQMQSAAPSGIPSGRRGVDQIPGYGGPVPAAQPAQAPLGKRAIEFAEPTVEALASVGGAALGTPLGPLGTVGGAGLGYGLAKGGTRALKTALGYEAPQTATDALVTGAKDVLTGSTMEAAGRGVIAPVIRTGMEYASKVKNIKLDTYLKAIGNKGEDIVNALRGRQSAVPGAAPTAGEVAAPAGSTGFSTLQARALEVPAMADTYGGMAAQTNVARTAQEGRVQSRAQGIVDRLKAKIGRGIANVPPEDSGRALTAIAEAEKQSVKKGVIEPAYKAAFDIAGDAKINVGNVIDEAETILGRKLSSFDPSTAPATVSKLLSLQPKVPEAPPLGKGLVSGKLKQAAPQAAAPEVTLQQLDDVRKAINADIAAAKISNDPAAATTLRNLGRLHKQIDEAVASSTTLTGEAKQAYGNALSLYRTEYAPRFKTGVNADLFKTTSGNEGKIKPEDVVKKYFQPNGVSEAEQFLSMFGKNPDALRIARSGIEDLYLREAGASITPEASAAFLRKYADPIRVLDNAGVNVTQRLNIVAKDAARLAKVQEIAEASKNKLAPSLPPGSNALAVDKRIAELTKGLTPQQLSHVNAVRDDLLREGEYQRLVDLGAKSDIRVRGLGTETGRELGLPLPSFLNNTITLFNNVFKRLALRLDDKIAMEIAREMTSPAKAADMVEAAMALSRNRELSQMPEFYGRAAAQFGNELARRAEPAPRSNALAP